MTSRYIKTTLGIAAALLITSWLIALRRPPPRTDIDLTRWVNAAPDAVAHAFWPVMQLGTLTGALIVALAVLVWKRSLALSATIAASAMLAYWAAIAVKNIVDRGRPIAYIADIHLREATAADHGYVSGHTAVAFACATALAPDLSRTGRIVVFALAATVGVARILYGVHFVDDVIGGAGLGLACGVAVRAVFDRDERRRAATS